VGAGAFRRDEPTNAARPFRGRTAEQRIAEALRTGEACLDVYLAALAPGTTREEARERLRRSKSLGRRQTDSSLS
jgi:hypothetical protein